MKLGIFVDTTDLYRTVYRKYSGRLNYDTYYDELSNGGEVVKAIAYGMRIGDATSFVNCLEAAGFETKFKNPKVFEALKICEWGISIAVDLFKCIDDLDVVIIGSSDPNLVPLINWAKSQGKIVRVVASLIPKIMREAATEHIEILESWLEENNEDN